MNENCLDIGVFKGLSYSNLQVWRQCNISEISCNRD